MGGYGDEKCFCWRYTFVTGAVLILVVHGGGGHSDGLEGRLLINRAEGGKSYLSRRKGDSSRRDSSIKEGESDEISPTDVETKSRRWKVSQREGRMTVIVMERRGRKITHEMSTSQELKFGAVG